MVRSLAERDFRARYKQAALGVTWALVQPLTLVLLFSLVFRRVATVHTGPVPYALFTLVALIPWTFFSSSVAEGSVSLITNQAVVTKVACPREVFGLARVGVAGIDAGIGALALPVMMVVTGTAPKTTSWWAVPLLALAVVFTASLTVLMSAIVVHLRDLRHVVPVLLQIGLFATPVAYSLAAIPSRWRVLYCALNPLAAVIDGLRSSVLYGHAPRASYLGAAVLSTAALVVVGFRVFKQLETGLADFI
jgi:ABC-2 type transport system permease protein/lipopolysaccharide transport system permease protein